MLPETEASVLAIRQQIQSAKKQLDEAKKRFGNNRDKYLLEQIKYAYWWLDDVEKLHLAMLLENRLPPRTLAQESSILVGANAQLVTALAQVKRIVEWSVTYGDKFQAVGV